ncbi:hypothetical protein DRO33_02285 [Candidatus Bathyarchaeota archaeon]|nr:MAG: hypothetical protein DRO33_02285 [Candidatus Bathyarchaeota archaeon]
MRELRALISDIISSGILDRLRGYPSHSLTGSGDRVLHSLRTAYLAYRLARILGADPRACARAALLHDVGYDASRGLLRAILEHAGSSARIALEFGEDDEVVRAIRDHMFPVSGRPPLGRVSLIIWLVDKVDSIMELLGLTRWLDRAVAELEGA